MMCLADPPSPCPSAGLVTVEIVVMPLYMMPIDFKCFIALVKLLQLAAVSPQPILS